MIRRITTVLFFVLSCFAFFRNAVRAQSGNLLFNDTSIHNIYLTFPQSNYWTLLTNNKSYDDANDSSTYIVASVKIDGTQLDSIGVQFKGNSSYYNYPGNKKPFTLSLDEYRSAQQYDGISSINLNNGYQDPTMLREKLFLDFCQKAGGINAPRSNFAKLYINNTYWGLYLLSERVTKTFCNNRFGNKNGNLFKGDKGTAACANLQYHGVLQPYYNCYELKTNTTANNWTDLINLTYQINQTTSAQFYDSVNKVMNTQSFIRAWAAYNLLADFDSYPYRYQHNYYTYHNTTTNKFEWIVWDVSTAFGLDIPLTTTQVQALSVLYLTPPTTNAPLTARMLQNAAYKASYLQTVCDFTKTIFREDTLTAQVNRLSNRIRAAYYADPNKMYTNQNFEDNLSSNVTIGSTTVPGLKSFITARYNAVKTELIGLGMNCNPVPTGIANVLQPATFIIFPNPATASVIIRMWDPKNTRISIMDMAGRIVIEQSFSSTSASISLAGIVPGIYTIMAMQDGKKMVQILSVQQ